MKQTHLFLLVAVVLSSCTPRPGAAPVINNEIVLAEVGKVKITDQDLLLRIQDIEENFPRNYGTHPQKKDLLSQMMNLELIYEEALRLGLDKDFAFKARLAETYINRLAREARAKITSKEVEAYYQAHKDNIDQIGARHILLKTKGKSKEDKALLEKKIEGIRKDLLQDPSRFSELAQKYSEDNSAAAGGDLGMFNRSMMVAPFSNAAFKLKALGDISPVTESEFGYHIIQLTSDRRGIKFYEEPIKDNLMTKAQKDLFEKEVRRLQKDKKLIIYEEALAKMSPLPKEILTDPAELIPQNGIPQENKKP